MPDHALSPTPFTENTVDTLGCMINLMLFITMMHLTIKNKKCKVFFSISPRVNRCNHTTVTKHCFFAVSRENNRPPPRGTSVKLEDNVRESFFSEDRNVLKIMHRDGSETAVKTVLSQKTEMPEGQVRTTLVERNKFSIFASASAGCFMKCSFCHLTAKNAKYSKISASNLMENLQTAMLHARDMGIETNDRYLKLSWMGMGEDAFVRPRQTREISLELIRWAMDNGLAKGLDGVDLSTVMPSASGDWAREFTLLNEELKQFPANPANFISDQAMEASFSAYDDRTPFRLFYSLHSAIEATRQRLIPKAAPIVSALERLRSFSDDNTPNLVFHHSFLQGENDSDVEMEALLALFDDPWMRRHELRILRYNHCDASDKYESERIDRIIARLAQKVPKLKAQLSIGSEVSAACGQFIVAAYANPKWATKQDPS